MPRPSRNQRGPRMADAAFGAHALACPVVSSPSRLCLQSTLQRELQALAESFGSLRKLSRISRNGGAGQAALLSTPAMKRIKFASEKSARGSSTAIFPWRMTRIRRLKFITSGSSEEMSSRAKP